MAQPAPGIVSRAESLAAEINKLSDFVEQTNVCCPVSALRRLVRANKNRAALRQEVKMLLAESLGMMRTHYQGPGVALATVQTQSLSDPWLQPS